MKDLHCFLIYTEHHTIQLDAALDYYSIPISKAIIVLPIYEHLHKDLKWVDRLKNKYRNCYSILQYKVWGLKKIQYFTYRSEIIKFKWDLIKLMPRIFSLYTSLYDDIAIVAYNILVKPKFTLLDEGTASYGVVVKRREKISKKIIVKKSILNLVLYSCPKRINYFSQYQMKIGNNDTIDNYKLKKTKNQILFINKSILLLGTSASEVNVISESNFLLLVEAVKKRFPNYTLNYYPHRFEREYKLIKIEQLGYNVLENNLPFELLFSSLTECSEILICFGSPILGNILQMFTVTPKCIMIKPHKDYYLKDSSIFMDIYENYSNYKDIEIWNIDK